MATVTVQILNKEYALVCDDGQEVHVRSLAQNVDARMRGLSKQLGNPGESMLWVMTALMLADELQENKQLKNKTTQSGDDEAVISAVEIMAERLEQLAMRLESQYSQ
jgi:cell division protein ZapA